MSVQSAGFRELHQSLFLMPNIWDAGSARIIQSLGFPAVATTSSGFAATLARLDGSVTLDEVLAHCTSVTGAVEVPVSADLENGFVDSPSDVGATYAAAAATGLAGGSIEDWSGHAIYDIGLAAERVAAARAAAPPSFVLTGRAENLIHGVDDLADTITRLQRYQEAGADVLFAPGLRALADIRTVVASVDAPLSVLVGRGAPPIAELAAAGVKRISVGGSLAFTALGALVEAATELRDHGTYGYADRTVIGLKAARSAFTVQEGA